jgi:hypothetical protein
MAYISLTGRVREVETQVGSILAAQDIDSLAHAERTLIISLKNQITDARLEVRDYEYADTRYDQLKRAKVARTYLAGVEQKIIKASEHGMFGAVDVAHITAQIESIAEALE